MDEKASRLPAASRGRVSSLQLCCLGLVSQALSAQGGVAPAVPTPSVVKGDRTLTVTWSSTADATGSSIYDVRYRLGSSTEHTELSDVGRGIGSRYYVLPKDLTNGETYKVSLRHRIGTASSAWSSEVDGTPGDLSSFALSKGVAVGGWLDDSTESDTFRVASLASYRTVCYVQTDGLGSDLTLSTSPSIAAAGTSYFGKWSRHVLAASGTYTLTISGGSEEGSGYDLLCRDAPADATSRANAYEIDERWPSDVRWGRQYDSYWYRFTVAEEQYVSARTLHYMDTVLILSDSTGKEVARSDDGWELGHVWTSAIPPRQVARGTYYLEVWFPRTESWDDHSSYGDHQSYRNIALHTEFIDSFEGGAAIESASPLTVDGFLATQGGRVSGVSGRRILLEGASIRPQYGLLASAGEADYWTLRVDDSAETNSDNSSPIVIRGTSARHSGLAAEILNSEGDPIEYLSYRRDSFGAGEAEHEGVGVDAFTVSGSFPNGTYYLKVYSVDRGQSSVSYVLTAAHDREITGFQANVASSTSPCNNAVPTGIEDPFFSCQWHLRQANSINVRGAWGAGHSGAGVEVAVVDDGLDMEHVDLRVDRSKGVDLSGGTDPFDWTRRHGTAVAGIVSSKGNSQGGRGVAYGSTVYGINYLVQGSAVNHVRAVTEHVATRGVSVHSYSLPSNGGLNRQDGTWFAAIDHGVKEGYGGLGTVYVKAGGNSGSRGDWTGFDEGNNHVGVIPVCGVDSSGNSPSGSSEPGPNLWVCGPTPGIFTTSSYGRYDSAFSGTSAAAPSVAGVAALVRGANNDLSWRDIKVILANTARKVDASDSGWKTRATKYGGTGSYEYNDDYGFGMVDANAAVAAADGWNRLPALIAERRCDDSPIVMTTGTSQRRSLTFSSSAIDFVEYVELNMDITSDDLGELVVYFGSPAQMVGGTDWAEIVDQSTYLTSSLDGTYKFGMTMFLGGTADGDWKLFVRRRSGDPIVVHGWEVVVYGHGTSSAASGSGVDDSGQLDSSREMSCGRTLDARTAYAVTNSARPPAAPSGLQPSAPWSWTDPRPVAAGAGPQYLYSGMRRFRTSSDWWWSTPQLMEIVPGTGTPPPTDPDPDPDPDPEPQPPEPEPVCPFRVAPYWHGTGGFAVRPSDGESAMFRIECAGMEYESREYAGEDGLIVRTVSQPMCTTDGDRPIEGEMTFEGIDGDGWYWVNGARNVAVAPLVCESSLNPELRPPMPVGVTARPTGDRRFVLSVRGTWHGTLMVHDETGFMGIVPHLVDLEGEGEHVAPYWKGGGGIVGRPLDGSGATVRLACGEADAESQVLEAGGDGLIVALLPGCFDEEGAALRGRLEADGLEDGAWYWLNTGTASAAAPLLRRGADVDLTTPVLPGGVDAEEGPLGTLFSRGPLLGVVPRVERVENE